MNDFDYDCMQKKRIASGAGHRKRGSKSKKCTLPSDYLTKKELRALNGEVKFYNIHERMDWKKFKSLPEDIAVAHMNWLLETFGCNTVALGEAFGCTDNTVAKWLKAHNMTFPYRRFMGSKEWLAFLGKMPMVDEIVEEPEEESVVGNTSWSTEARIVRTPDPEANPIDIPGACKVFGGDLSMRGSKAAMLQKLFDILPDDVTGLRVAFEVNE